MENSLTTGERPDLAAMFDRPVSVEVRSFDYGEKIKVAVKDGTFPDRRWYSVALDEQSERAVYAAITVLKGLLDD